MKARANLFFWGLFCIFFLYKLLLALQPHVVFWDEAVYIGMGKYLYSSGSVGLWETLRPLVLPGILGGLWSLGMSFFAMEVVMLFFSAGTVVVTYLIGKELYNEDVGAFAGLALLLSPVFFLNSGLFLTDIPSVFFIVLSIYFFLKNYYFASGIFSAIAFLTRFPHGLIAVIVAWVILYPQWRTGLDVFKKYLAGFITAVVPFFVFNFILYKDSTNPLYAILRPIIFASPHQYNPFAPSGGIFFYAVELLKDSPIFIFSILGVFLFVRKENPKARLIFFAFFTYLFYFSIISNKQLRFALSFLPMAAIAAGFGIEWLISKKRLSFFAAAALFLIAFSSFSTDSMYAGWRHQSEPPIVTDFYRYMEGHSSDEVALTSDPVPAAYTDHLYVPYYFSVKEGLPIVSEAVEEDKVSIIFYSPRSFPCGDYDDICLRERSTLHSIITRKDLAFNTTFYNQDYFVYIT